MTARKPEAHETRIPELPDAVRGRLREVADEWLHVKRTNLTEVRKALVEILCGTWLAGRRQRFADDAMVAVVGKPDASETTLTMARGWLTAHVDPYGDVARDEGASLAALLDAERERWNQEVCVALYEQSPRSADEAIDIVQALLRPATTPETT